MLHAQPLQAGLAGGLHVLGAAVDATRLRVGRVQADAELGGQHHLPAAPGDGTADQHFIGVRAVHVGGVEQGDAAFQRAVDHRDGRGIVAAAAVERAHAHAAEAEGGNHGTVAAKGAGLHGNAPDGGRPL